MPFESNIRKMKWMEIKFQGDCEGMERGGRGLAINLISAWTFFANRDRSDIAGAGPIRGVFAISC